MNNTQIRCNTSETNDRFLGENVPKTVALKDEQLGLSLRQDADANSQRKSFGHLAIYPFPVPPLLTPEINKRKPKPAIDVNARPGSQIELAKNVFTAAVTLRQYIQYTVHCT